VQEEARVAAQGFADRKQAVADSIAQVQERARQQKIADDAAIAAANQVLTVVKNIETARIAAAQLGATNAQNAANAADAEYLSQLKVLALMGQKQTALDAYIKSWKDFIDYLKTQNIPVPAFFGAPATTQVQSPVPGNAPETPGGKPQLPPGAPPPPPAPGGPSNPGGPGFFGRVALPAYTAPAALTASFARASLTGDLVAFVVPPPPAMPRYVPPVPPDIAAPYLAGGAYATALTRGGTAIDTGSGAGQLHVARDLVHIDTVNASDPRDVDRLVERVKTEAFGEHLGSFDAAKRGSVIPWQRR
jgi:hypothetical protein